MLKYMRISKKPKIKHSEYNSTKIRNISFVIAQYLLIPINFIILRRVANIYIFHIHPERILVRISQKTNKRCTILREKDIHRVIEITRIKTYLL